MTSGAIQKGVPTNVCRCDLCEDNCAATPKSAATVSDAAERTLTKLDGSIVRQQDVCGLDVAVDFALGVQVREAHQQLAADNRDLGFREHPGLELPVSDAGDSDIPSPDNSLLQGTPSRSTGGSL